MNLRTYCLKKMNKIDRLLAELTKEIKRSKAKLIQLEMNKTAEEQTPKKLRKL